MPEKTTSVQIVLPQHCNGYAKPRLFGGQMMAWIDVVGAVDQPCLHNPLESA